MLGYGDGTFQAPVYYTAGASSVAVAVGDFNGDTKPDVVCANGSGQSVSILLNDGAGLFLPQTQWFAGHAPQAVAVADLNADGRQDLALRRRPDAALS